MLTLRGEMAFSGVRLPKQVKGEERRGEERRGANA